MILSRKDGRAGPMQGNPVLEIQPMICMFMRSYRQVFFTEQEKYLKTEEKENEPWGHAVSVCKMEDTVGKPSSWESAKDPRAEVAPVGDLLDYIAFCPDQAFQQPVSRQWWGWWYFLWSNTCFWSISNLRLVCRQDMRSYCFFHFSFRHFQQTYIWCI